MPSALHPKSLTLGKLKEETGWPPDGILGLASFKVTAWVLGYYLSSLVLLAVLPGVESEGVELKSGGKLKYKFNGTSGVIPRSQPLSTCWLIIIASLQLSSSSSYCRAGRYNLARTRLSLVDLYLGQLYPIDNRQPWDRFFSRMLCLCSELFGQGR